MRLIYLLLVSLTLIACDNTPKEQVIQIHGQTMGTTYHISWTGQHSNFTQRLQKQVDERLKNINKSMSTYDSESELSLINRGLAVQDEQGWITLSNDLNEVLAMSLQVWQQSQGGFDITIGPLVNLWGFGPQARLEHTPSVEEIQQLLTNIGSEYVQLNASEQRLRLERTQYLDLSAIAKGWAVDQIADLLEQAGLHSFLVEIGGEIMAKGKKPNGQPWRIAIEKPESLLKKSSNLVVELDGVGVATSGSYRNYYEEEGVRYSHTIDPQNGYPIKHNLASVTVVHSSTGMADAWATALTVSGPEKGLQLAEAHNLAVYMQVGQEGGFTEYYSSAFKAQFPQVGGK